MSAVYRRKRRAAMNATSDIREHMQVVASHGTPLGKVDHLDGDRIKLEIERDWRDRLGGTRFEALMDALRGLG